MPHDTREIENALSIAEVALASRFEAASCAFVAGSIIRGQSTVSSDIDLVVVFDRLDVAWRESFMEGSQPVEAFVHDPETLAWFIEQDIARGHPIMLDMIASGFLIGPNFPLAKELQADASRRLAKGPNPLTVQRRDELRYVITDLIDDLRGERSAAEIRAISCQLYQPLADLILLGRSAWSGKGKWLPRLLQRLDRRLAEDFDNAFRLSAHGNSTALLLLSEMELGRHGGPWFAGDKREAPASCRLVRQDS